MKSAAIPLVQARSVSSAPNPIKKSSSSATTATGAHKARLERVRFAVIPDATTRALELRKGSADIAVTSLTGDMVLALEREINLEVLRAPGTVLAYLAFNTRDPILKDVRVRQALAYAIDRTPMIHYLLRDFARPAYSLLPPESWAYNGDVPHYDLQSGSRAAIARASRIPSREWRALASHHEDLDRGEHALDGCRAAAAIARGWHRAGHSHFRVRHFFFRRHARRLPGSLVCVGLEETKIRTFLNMYFTPRNFRRNGANRTYYANPRVDALIDQARRRTRPKRAQADLCRDSANPGRRLALHQLMVFRERNGAHETCAQSDFESTGKL